MHLMTIIPSDISNQLPTELKYSNWSQGIGGQTHWKPVAAVPGKALKPTIPVIALHLKRFSSVPLHSRLGPWHWKGSSTSDNSPCQKSTRPELSKLNGIYTQEVILLQLPLGSFLRATELWQGCHLKIHSWVFKTYQHTAAKLANSTRRWTGMYL